MGRVAAAQNHGLPRSAPHVRSTNLRFVDGDESALSEGPAAEPPPVARAAGLVPSTDPRLTGAALPCAVPANGDGRREEGATHAVLRSCHPSHRSACSAVTGATQHNGSSVTCAPTEALGHKEGRSLVFGTGHECL